MTRQEAIEKIRAIPQIVERLEKKGLTVEQVPDIIWQAWLIGKSLS